MNYIYLITTIILYLLILFIKKDNRQHNFVIDSTILGGVFYSFNIFYDNILPLVFQAAFVNLY